MRRRSTPPRADGGDRPKRAQGLVRRYAALCDEFHGVPARAPPSPSLLGPADMRARATALAVIRDGACIERNPRWVHVAGDGAGRWRREGSASGRADGGATLESLTVAAAAELAGSGDACLSTRCERADGEAVVEVRLEHAPPAVLATISDVTDRVRHERELRRMREAVESQERLRALGELASGVAHELNNTLHALQLRLARLSECSAGCRDHEGDLRDVERIAGDAAARVRRLQDLAGRREDVPDERVELAAAVADAVEVVRPHAADAAERGGPVEIRVDLAGAAPVVGNRGELAHVFVNLLLNALDAMPAGGRVTVGGQTRADGQVDVTVADEGAGIPADHLERIFEPFFTTKGRRGTGLGLSVAAGVMRRLGGTIRAANRPDGGAQITLRFTPRSPARAAPPSPLPPRASAEPRRVLVVDDDPDNLEAMRLILSHDGHVVEVTEYGLDAVGRVAAGERYDTVFCDLGLGDATGWEVASRIEALAPGTPVLLVTGWANEIRPDDPRRRHVAGILPKPVGAEELRRLVRDAPPPTRPGRAAPARPPSAQPAAPAVEDEPGPAPSR